MTTGNIITRRYYNGDYEKTIDAQSGSILSEINYISCAGGLVAMFVKDAINPNGKMYYPYKDHLGSIVTVMNETGTEKYEQSFDAWGRNRNPSDWTYSNIPAVPAWLYRGYTGHEHLPQFALINMNGRMYDPVVGRMLSPDNSISPTSQGLNKYSYALNNPLKYTDPDGNNPMLAALGLFVFGSIIDHLLSYNYYEHKSFGEAVKAGFNQGLNAYNQINSVTQIPVYNENGVTVTVGPSLTGLGITGGVSYTNGDWTVGASTGAFYGGGYAIGGGVSYYDRPNDQYFSYYYSHFSGRKDFFGTTIKPQNVGGIGYSKGDFSFKLENDIFAFQGFDRWRTGGFEAGIGDFVIGSQIYTNDPGAEENVGENGVDSRVDYNGTNMSGKLNRYNAKAKTPMGAWKNGLVYRSTLSVGYKSGNTIAGIGINHPMVQDKTQNVIHRYANIGKWSSFGRQHYYNNYSQFRNQGFYSYSGSYNPYSIYGY